MNHGLLRLGNFMFEKCYFFYYPLYSIYKTIVDRHERALLKKLIKPGMTVVDVGANIGIYTRYLSKLVGPRGVVHAFEPAPQNFKKLIKNMRHFPNTVLQQAAVGSHDGTTSLYLSEKLNVDHHTFESGESRHKIDVPICSLDHYFSQNKKIDLLKIDVQGYEWHVLHGAQRMLQENSNIKILMEFWPYGLNKADVSPQHLISYIHLLGFKINKSIDTMGHSFDYKRLNPDNENDYVNLLISK